MNNEKYGCTYKKHTDNVLIYNETCLYHLYSEFKLRNLFSVIDQLFKVSAPSLNKDRDRNARYCTVVTCLFIG
jgi:hypothetical protein